jgi:hypoxanthine phosphoribosyltransferase/uncharacterized HAD superfamily protein
MIHYVSYSRLWQDVLDFARLKLPRDITAVCGVPRSGILVATMIATELHIPLYVPDAGQLVGYRVGRAHLTYGKRIAEPPKRWLLIDDATNSGSTMSRYRGDMSPAYTAAIYVSPAGRDVVDFYHKIVPKPRVFEWNLFSSKILRDAVLEMDGVLCYDIGSVEDKQAPKAYERQLRAATLRHMPRRNISISGEKQIGAICTSRLERYRKVTEEWLRRHEIDYGALNMYPAKTAAARRDADDAVSRKAEYYVSQEQQLLFIESNLKQGEQIFKISGKPVLVPTAGVLFQNK